MIYSLKSSAILFLLGEIMKDNKTRICLKTKVFRNFNYITPTAKVLKLIKEEMKVTYVLKIVSDISCL